MASLTMGRKVYDFNSESIDKAVTKESPGNYALGFTRKNGRFVPEYVGRSDSDVKAELKKKLDEKTNEELTKDKYSKFKFSYAKSATEAYKKECQNYHDFLDQLDNKIHPAKPKGTDLKCPVCGE